MSQFIQAWVRRPQRQISNQRGREQMNVDPSGASPMQTAVAHECNNFVMGNHFGMMKTLIIFQRPETATLIADQEFAVN